MKSYILHGDNLAQSRQRLGEIIKEAKSKGWQVLQFEWKAGIKNNILSASRSEDIFSSNILLVIENFFKGNKKATEILEELTASNGSMFVFWENTLISQAVISKVGKLFLVQEFKLPVVIFKFLDSIFPKNGNISLKYLSKIGQDEADFLLIMLSGHLRKLIWVKTDPESLKASPWQKNNLEKQSKKFSIQQLYDLHHKLLELDRMNKKSQLPENLYASLEVLASSL